MKLMKLMSILTLAFFVGCTGSSDEPQVQDETETTTAASRTIDIIGINSMKFAVLDRDIQGIETGDPAQQEEDLVILDEIHASPGETITIRLSTRSQMPASAMSHNWVLLTMEADDDAFAAASAMAADNDYIDPDLENLVIAQTGMAGGGETTEVTFTVPQETGDYPFICTFPGHYLGGMTGTLIVEE